MNYRVCVAAIIEKDGKFLFGKKSPGVGPYPGKWLLLGGGVNLGDESVEDAVRREIREEGNIEVKNLIPLSFDEDKTDNKEGVLTHYIFLQYKVDYASGDPNPGDDIKILQWFLKEELKDLDLSLQSIRLLKLLRLL